MTVWGEPRPGTEAYAVKQEVLRRQKLARERGLDKLLSDAYHEDGLRNYEAWFNNDRNKRWVHPDVSEVVNGEAQIDGKQVSFVEFNMDAHKYKVTSRKWWGESDEYNDLVLYMDGRRVFEIQETINSNQYCTTYRPCGIDAYVNDEWADAFKKLKEHHKRVSEQTSIEFAEDQKRLQEAKEAFGIGTIPQATETIREPSTMSPVAATSAAAAVKIARPNGKKVGVWIVIAIVVILTIWWATS